MENKIDCNRIKNNIRLSMEKYKNEKWSRVRNLVNYHNELMLNNAPKMENSFPEDNEIIKFWNKYFPEDINVVFGVKYYSNITGNFSPYYITDGLYYALFDTVLNHREFAEQFDNKAYYPLLFHDVKQPNFISIRINGTWLDVNYSQMSFENVVNACMEREGVFVKVAKYSAGGTGVKYINTSDSTKLISVLNSHNSDIVIQDVIEQHNNLKILHADSVNTIRIMTLLWNNSVRVLSSVLRMGINGSKVDNASAGGITCGIKDDGYLKSIAFDKYGNKYEMHPQGTVFSDIQIPVFEKVKNIAMGLQMRFPYSAMISWDFAIGVNGEPILIEANFMRGELDFHQLNNGPIFGSETEKILETVIKKYF